MLKIISTFFLFVLLAFRVILNFTFPKPFKDGDRIRISATINSEPISYQTAQYLKLQGLRIYLPLIPEYYYGDRITVEGMVYGDKLIKPIVVNSLPSANLLYKFRSKLLNFYSNSLPLPHSALIAGVTIGSKSGIPRDFWEKLKNSGTAHVVVASGMNITLVGGFLINFLVLFFKRKKALLFALVGIWLYALVSGFDAPIVRSAIMGSIAFSAQEFGRLNFSIRALFLSGITMILINPTYIIDVGFLLSFFATLGLILFESKIEKYFAKWKLLKRTGKVGDIIKTDLSTTLAAQIGVVPLLYYYFGQFNFLSPIINVLILWTVVPITIIGMVGGIVGLVVPLLGRGILLLAFPLTSWFITVVNLFG